MGLVSEFKEALVAEINEQKKKGTTSWSVRSGRLIEVRGSLFIYSFVLDDPTLAGIFDDTPVRVRTTDSDASGHIIGVSGPQILVAIEDNLGEYVASARVLAQPYYLLERLVERLDTLQEASCVLARKCLRMERFRFGQDDRFTPHHYIRSEWEQLSSDQRVAVLQSLGSEVCYIWGPPGTGKTTTVGVAVASMIQCGHKVLLVANTNVAVDKALEASLRSLRQTDHYREGRILRLGTPQTKEISADDNLNLDRITEFKTKPLEDGLLKLREKLASEEQRLAKLGALRADLERWEELKRLLAKEESARVEVQNLLDSLAVREGAVVRHLEMVSERYERAKAMSVLSRFVQGMNLKKMKNALSRLEAERNALGYKRADTEKKLEELITSIEKLRREARAIEQNLKRESVSPTVLKIEIAGTRTKIDELCTQIAELERQIAGIRQQIINEAVLIATTLARTYTMPEVYERRFDALVCDEASMAPIPAIFWACSLTTKSVTVAGDFRQLAPIAVSKHPKVKEWLRRDIYAAAGVDREQRAQQPGNSPMIMLTTQYRMQPQIRALISSVFYQDRLRDGIAEASAIRHNEPCPGAYVGIYDTSVIDPWCSRTSSYSRFNLYHAVLAVRLCQSAIRDFQSIGIISPYKAQTRLIKALVDMDPELREKVVVSNVHRFQGSEKDLIIFDVVDSTGLPVGKLLKGSIASNDVDEADGARLINVACSRARKKLAIIANLSFLRSNLEKDWSVYKVLFNEASPLPVFAAEQLVPDYSDPVIRAGSELLWPPQTIVDAVTSLWTEERFHSELRHDLEQSKQYAIIMSPFVTRERLQTYIDLLRAKVEQGIKLEVVTRPPHQQGTLDKNNVEKMLNYLEQVGVKVKCESSMHQKVIVIDGQVVWFGSLNPLSHRNTRELMFRVANEDFTKQVMQECGLKPPDEEGKYTASAIDISMIPPRLCSKCGRTMTVVPRGRFGPFYRCDSCNSTGHVKRDDLEQAILLEARICPECGRRMEIRQSKTGMFLGCSGFRDQNGSKRCRYTRPL